MKCKTRQLLAGLVTVAALSAGTCAMAQSTETQTPPAPAPAPEMKATEPAAPSATMEAKSTEAAPMPAPTKKKAATADAKKSTKKAATAEAKKAKKAAAPAAAGAKEDKAMIMAVQEALNKQANTQLKVDGMMNKPTAKALKSFQKANKLKQTGKPDKATLAKLGVAS